MTDAKLKAFVRDVEDHLYVETGETDRPGTYLPTPAEIEAACKAIRDAWSPRERYWRQRGCDVNGVTIGSFDARKTARAG